MRLLKISSAQILLRLDSSMIQRLMPFSFVDLEKQNFTICKNVALGKFLFVEIDKVTPFHLQQKGTVVERLTEEIVRDMSHLKELLAACEGKTLILVFHQC